MIVSGASAGAPGREYRAPGRTATLEYDNRDSGVCHALVSHAHTVWEGTLFEGSGTVFFDSSNLPQQKVTWKARAEEHGGLTSPEELIAAAHSSCFSMALSNALAKAGTPAKSLHTEARSPSSRVRASRHPHRGPRRGPGDFRRRLRQGGRGRQGELPGEQGAGGHSHHLGRGLEVTRFPLRGGWSLPVPQRSRSVSG